MKPKIRSVGIPVTNTDIKAARALTEHNQIEMFQRLNEFALQMIVDWQRGVRPPWHRDRYRDGHGWKADLGGELGLTGQHIGNLIDRSKKPGPLIWAKVAAVLLHVTLEDYTTLARAGIRPSFDVSVEQYESEKRRCLARAWALLMGVPEHIIAQKVGKVEKGMFGEESVGRYVQVMLKEW